MRRSLRRSLDMYDFRLVDLRRLFDGAVFYFGQLIFSSEESRKGLVDCCDVDGS